MQRLALRHIGFYPLWTASSPDLKIANAWQVWDDCTQVGRIGDDTPNLT